jgi:hypothetical protein
MTARLWLPGLAALLLACAPAGAAAPPPPDPKPPTARDVQALADKVDEHLARGWARAAAKPAPPADDAEFLRRIYLDLAGRIPTVAEARAFLADRRADRRARLVSQLLSGSRYPAHFTNVWRALLIPEAGNNFQVRLTQGGFEGWLKQRLTRNVGYDRMVRELLTAKVAQDGGFPFGASEASTLPFFLAKEFKPENLASSAARVFLGVSVECAQCHNHPFADWKREQFWGFAAFFAGIKAQRLQDFMVPGIEDPRKHEIAIPGSGKVIQARFLDGAEPNWKSGVTTRAALADWLASPDNPYFARATVNRLWAYLFGTGLVEPVDEMVGGSGAASHPELLVLLAREFSDRRFDLRFLLQALTATKAYQLSSAATDRSQDDPTLFARRPLKGLTAEQLFDSVAAATGYRDSGGGDDFFTAIVGGPRSARSEFLTKFAPSERPTEAQTSILQALTLMNGKVVEAATSLEKSETLAAVVDAPFATTAERVEVLYLATLSRKPTAKEQARAVRFVRDALGRSGGKEGKALADVFWALLNSPEFQFNH